jgi:hypothetical protein
MAAPRLLALVFAAFSLSVGACRPAEELPTAADLTIRLAEDLAAVPVDLRPPPDLMPVQGDLRPGEPLPPSFCNQRRPGVTALRAAVQVDEYRGLQKGRNGTHEIVEGTITATPWVYQAAAIDTRNVEVAMNVQDETDPHGLPREIPLRRGQRFEVQGEYIPASQADARNNNGPAAVIHFTHSPCGYVLIDGTVYR